MTKVEKEAYYRHLDNIVILRDNINTERAEGRAEGRVEGRAEGLEVGRAEGLEVGRAEGRAEGRTEGRAEGLEVGRAEGEKLKQTEIARNMKNMGMDIGTIAAITGMSEEEISKI